MKGSHVLGPDLTLWAVGKEADEHAASRGVEPALSRGRLIERIISINSSASPDFLARFSLQQLESYLEHLASADEPRGRSAVWVRRGDTPAIVTREAPE